MSTGADRVRRNTADRVIAEIDRETLRRIRPYANVGAARIGARIRELDAEWDIERVLETNASTIALTGLVLGLTVHKRFFLIPGIVLPFLLQHATQGWCPPMPVLRRLGIRTREGIDLEKYALKALRGDFRVATAHKTRRGTRSSKRVTPATANNKLRAELPATDLSVTPHSYKQYRYAEQCLCLTLPYKAHVVGLLFALGDGGYSERHLIAAEIDAISNATKEFSHEDHGQPLIRGLGWGG